MRRGQRATIPAPSHAPKTSDVLAEVCKVIPNPVSNGYYAVYVDTPRGGAQYCAWHSSTSSSYGTLAYTNMPYVTDAGASCGANFNGLGSIRQSEGFTLAHICPQPKFGTGRTASC